MSAQPKPNTSANAEYFVVVSDGRAPVGAVGPFAARDKAAVVYRAIRLTIPGVFAGVATRRPAKGVPIVGGDGIIAPAAMEALLSRAARAAKRHEISVVTEDGDRGRDRR